MSQEEQLHHLVSSDLKPNESLEFRLWPAICLAPQNFSRTQYHFFRPKFPSCPSSLCWRVPCYRGQWTGRCRWLGHCCCQHSSADRAIHEQLDWLCKDRIVLHFCHPREHDTQGWGFLCSNMTSQTWMLLCTGAFQVTWRQMASFRRCTHPNVRSTPLY